MPMTLNEERSEVAAAYMESLLDGDHLPALFFRCGVCWEGYSVENYVEEDLTTCLSCFIEKVIARCLLPWWRVTAP